MHLEPDAFVMRPMHSRSSSTVVDEAVEVTLEEEGGKVVIGDGMAIFAI